MRRVCTRVHWYTTTRVARTDAGAASSAPSPQHDESAGADKKGGKAGGAGLGVDQHVNALTPAVRTQKAYTFAASNIQSIGMMAGLHAPSPFSSSASRRPPLNKPTEL